VCSVGKSIRRHNELFSESEFFDQFTVALEVLLAKVGQQTLPFTNQLHQAAMSRKIFFVSLQMFGNTVDPFGQQGDLAFDRAGVGGGAAEISKESRFLLFCQIRHLKFFNKTSKGYSSNLVGKITVIYEYTDDYRVKIDKKIMGILPN
jgi:hypothetical protein